MPAMARLLCGLLPALVMAGCSRPTAPEPVLLGYLATAGESGQRGAQLAVKEANESEGLVSGRRVALLAPSLSPAASSSAAEAKKSEGSDTLQAIASRLVSVNRVPALIGGSDVPQVEALGRAAQPAGAFVVAQTVLPTNRLGDNVFPAQLALADQGTLLARFAVEELKADRVTLLVGSGQRDAEFADAFARQFTKDDGSRKVERRAFTEKPDWTTLAKEIHGSSSKAIVIAAGAGELAQLRAACAEAGSKAPVLFGGSAQDQASMEVDHAAGHAVYLATLHTAEGDSKHREFPANFRKEFGEPPDEAARLGYDAARLLIAALRRSRFVSRDRLREELTKAFVVRLDEEKLTEAKSYKLPGK
jgi:branched-chain amino acid transport system substrate-binding protein